MRTPILFVALTLAFSASRPARAEPMDPAAARELLKQGYALKQQKKYAEALERLLESLRLDSQIKTLINIADCEEKLGHLVLAQKHWILARDQASLQGAEPLKSEAEKRLTALEARMPRLTIKVTEPPGVIAEVRRDGVLLGRVTLGVPLPIDAGTHDVRVTAPDHAEQRYSVESVENDSKVLEVTVGPATSPRAAAMPVTAAPSTPATGAAAAAALPTPKKAETASATATPVPTKPAFEVASPNATPTRDSLWSTQRVAAISVASLGAVALGASGYTWWRANGQHDKAQGGCTPGCSDSAREMQRGAQSNAKLSAIFVVTGGVLLGSGGALWLTAPTTHRHDSASVGFIPTLGPRDAGVIATGAF